MRLLEMSISFIKMRHFSAIELVICYSVFVVALDCRLMMMISDNFARFTNLLCQLNLMAKIRTLNEKQQNDLFIALQCFV